MGKVFIATSTVSDTKIEKREPTAVGEARAGNSSTNYSFTLQIGRNRDKNGIINGFAHGFEFAFDRQKGNVESNETPKNRK